MMIVNTEQRVWDTPNKLIFPDARTPDVLSSSANIANTLLKQALGQDGMSAIDFAAGLMEAYEAGQIGEKTVRDLADAEFAGKLTTGQREAAYNRGKRMGYKDAYRRQQDVKKKPGGKKEGKLHFDRKGRKFDSVRESSLAVMDTLAKALGVDKPFLVRSILSFQQRNQDGHRQHERADSETEGSFVAAGNWIQERTEKSV